MSWYYNEALPFSNFPRNSDSEYNSFVLEYWFLLNQKSLLQPYLRMVSRPPIADSQQGWVVLTPNDRESSLFNNVCVKESIIA